MSNNAMNPTISVVMAAYNEEKSIARAMQSIIDQTYRDWELIIVDDGSTDRTLDIVNDYSGKDARIRLLTNELNLGLAASLNKGISASSGKYIARMDADDISYSDRLELQKEYLDLNPDISVVGGNADLSDESGDIIRSTEMPTTPQEIEKEISRLCPFVHPSVMYRKSFIQDMGGYDANLRKGEDYDLWLRGFMTHHYANISNVVVRYTIQTSKPIKTDLYGFYVRVRNAIRRRDFVRGVFWAFVVLSVNIMRKFGYRQRMHRVEK